jgi:GxxExxY protein
VTDADLAIVVSFGAGSLLDERLPNFLRHETVYPEWQERSVAEGLLYPELTNRLFEALHQVHAALGPGFLHQVYRRATMVELEHGGLSYDYVKHVPITYRGHYLGQQPARLINVDDKVLLATVAVKQTETDGQHLKPMQEQLKARLRDLDLRLGLLANFHGTKLQVIPVRA